jgi:hypothetical protein
MINLILITVFTWVYKRTHSNTIRYIAVFISVWRIQTLRLPCQDSSYTQKAGCHLNKTGSKQSFFSLYQANTRRTRLAYEFCFKLEFPPQSVPYQKTTVFCLSVPVTSVHFKISPSLKRNLQKNPLFLLVQHTDFLMTVGLSPKSQDVKRKVCWGVFASLNPSG